MNDLSKSEEIVKQLFIDYPETKDDDNLLYHTYIKKCTCARDFERLFYDSKYRKYCNASSYKTIVRNARKLREKFPEFNPKQEILEAKQMKQEEFIEYSRF